MFMYRFSAIDRDYHGCFEWSTVPYTTNYNPLCILISLYKNEQQHLSMQSTEARLLDRTTGTRLHSPHESMSLGSPWPCNKFIIVLPLDRLWKIHTTAQLKHKMCRFWYAPTSFSFYQGSSQSCSISCTNHGFCFQHINVDNKFLSCLPIVLVKI